MFDKRLKYSYAEQRMENIKKLVILLWISAFFIAHLLLTSFIVTTREMRNASMQPAISPGERILFLSFGLKELFPEFPLLRTLPVKRGDVVLITIKDEPGRNIFARFAEKICRFVTLGMAGFGKSSERHFLKRVIALPGDEVSMTKFVMRVKPADDMYTYTEFELSKDLYPITIPETPPLWDEKIPFSGNMEPMTLGSGSYFVLSDDRANTNDSRTWGQIPAKYINAKALFRYWPLIKFGKI
ncbi:MAG: signal peptidase I [Spirochaetaceae bacterium]|jgi:signal peptidase I|nr:signal peptidase I [Spirochaetaceae bacterium]